MKRTNIFYWICTGLLGTLILLGAIPDLIMHPQAIEIFKHLGYPAYLLPFLGVAKILGVIAILVPGFPRIKEWAYAGLFFDLSGALYSHIAIGDPAANWLPILLFGLPLLVGSYLLPQANEKSGIVEQREAGVTYCHTRLDIMKGAKTSGVKRQQDAGGSYPPSLNITLGSSLAGT